MPAWSPEIANEFIRWGTSDNRWFDQLQLQGLVYLAHGWCLAIIGNRWRGIDRRRGITGRCIDGCSMH